MVAVVARYTLLEGKAGEFSEIVKELVSKTREEKGCILYECCKSNDDPLKFIMMEKWESKEHIDAHIESAHFKELVPKMRALLAERTVELYSPL